MTIAVKPRRKIAKGMRRVSIEAMKIETMLAAERDAVVKAVHVKPGDMTAANGVRVEFA